MSTTEVIFVGTGPAMTPPGRGNIAFMVRGGGHSLLVECGPVILDGLRHAGLAPGDIDTVFISHRHGDHTLGFPMLILERMIARNCRPLHAVTGRSLQAMLTELVTLVYPEAAETLACVVWHTLDEERPDEVTLDGGMRLRTWPVCGPAGVPSLGLRVECPPDPAVAYTGDTARCESLLALAAGSGLLIHEANFSARLDPGVDATRFSHSTVSEAARVAQAAGAQRLALVHLNREYAGREEEVAQEAREVYGGEVLVPYDGAVVRLAEAGA